MKKNTEGVERFRVRNGNMASNESYGFNGAFFIPWWKDPTITFKVICSDGDGLIPWRPKECDIPLPPQEAVGIQSLGVIQ